MILNHFKRDITLILKTFQRNKREMTISNKCTDIVWMDLEMTGLDVNKDQIIEISCLITDSNLNVKSTGPCCAIYQPKEVLDKMHEWCKINHNKSGLVEKCLQSQITISDAEDMLLSYLKHYIPPSTCPLAGNSVYMDRLFLRQYMPKVNDYLHYRIVDVSSVKELAMRLNPKVYENAPKKILKHRSLDDILESIAELRYYKENFFIVN